MNGLEISKAYWEEYGRPLFFERFPQWMDKIAIGLLGRGSECMGFDDEISRDHDFEPGFCVFLPGEETVDRKTAFAIERAYLSLPKEYRGLTRLSLAPVGGHRHGVFRAEEFLQAMTGLSRAPDHWKDYLSLPDQAMVEIGSGEIFHDPSNILCSIHKAWQNPAEDVCRKKAGGHLIAMSQTGEYNYPRCLARKDEGAAGLCGTQFVTSAIGAACWLHGKPMPYYKWAFRFLKTLPDGENLAEPLIFIMKNEKVTDNIALTIRLVLDIVEKSPFGTETAVDLQKTAIEINKAISDPELRNLSILAAI